MPKPSERYTLADLREIVAALMAPDGCPWDRVQTLETMRQYLLEETHELLEAMVSTPEEHKTELGDLLFQVLFQAGIREREGAFTFDDAVDAIAQKLVRRHPHIFGEEAPWEHPDEARWERTKLKEKRRESLMDDIPRGYPALLQAEKIQRRAAAVGFDWPNAEGPAAKVEEERQEVFETLREGNRTAIEEEFGDLLFAVVNWARHHGINPEVALLEANQKFQRRFRLMEKLTREEGKRLQDLPLEIQDHYWEKAKAIGNLAPPAGKG